MPGVLAASALTPPRAAGLLDASLSVGKHYLQDHTRNTSMGVVFPASHPCNSSLFGWEQPAYDMATELLKYD